jgi:hypothetical protein
MSDEQNKSEQNEQKTKPKRKRRNKSCEHTSDRRTAEFLARQLGEVQDQLCDLIADMRTFEHYSEIEDAGWCLMLMQRLKRKYRKFAEEGTWPEAT